MLASWNLLNHEFYLWLWNRRNSITNSTLSFTKLKSVVWGWNRFLDKDSIDVNGNPFSREVVGNGDEDSGHLELGLFVGSHKDQSSPKNIKEENFFKLISDSCNLIGLTWVSIRNKLIKIKINFIINDNISIPDQSTGKNIHVV